VVGGDYYYGFFMFCSCHRVLERFYFDEIYAEERFFGCFWGFVGEWL
jgi:hypothetical protein